MGKYQVRILLGWQWYTAHVSARQVARRVGYETNTDVWRNLAAAVILQAVFDASGRNQWVYEADARDRLIAGAQRWLLSGAGAALLAALDLDSEAVLDALTHPRRRPTP